MRLTKIHRILEFAQSKWLKTYIDFNTEKRKNARNDFEKDFFKLMNNSVFGETMENLRKRVNVKLINTEKQLKKLTASPLFDYFRIFDENLVAVNMRKPSLYLNRPIYVGFCILDLSKTLMYDFHYNYIKAKAEMMPPYCSPTRTVSAMRSRPRTYTKTWVRTSTFLIPRSTRETTPYTVRETRKCWGR